MVELHLLSEFIGEQTIEVYVIRVYQFPLLINNHISFLIFRSHNKSSGKKAHWIEV